jgi:type II secretory ATPase GspE/PulE/Tfp pilus assembly ATPase PilB-like protein
VRVRFRIDGALHDVLDLPGAIGPALVSRIKIMAGMNIVERRRPQDGQIAMRSTAATVDIRVSTTAVIWGEKVVMRLLDKSRPLFKLDELGMPPTPEHASRADARSLRHGDLRRPDRQRQDHDALRVAGRDQQPSATS